MRVVLIAWMLFLPALASAQGAPAENDPRAAFAASDENQDGRIDHEEFHHRIVQMFYFADDDRDGHITQGQMNAFDEASMFANGDSNSDSKLSLYEFVNFRFRNFREADTDTNGTLSVDEVVAAFNNG
jgi:Ca2+-binding EF-hand superfamily protein